MCRGNNGVGVKCDHEAFDPDITGMLIIIKEESFKDEEEYMAGRDHGCCGW